MRRIRILDEDHVIPNPGGQENFLRDWEHPRIALEGGWMSGKTWAGARKLVAVHLWNAFDRQDEATGVPSVVVAPTYQNAVDYDLPQLEEAFVECNLNYQYHSTKQYIELYDLGTRSNPSIIWVRSSQHPDRITGWEVGAAWGDEATRWPTNFVDPRRDAYIQLTGRVRHPRARFRQLMLTYTHEGDATRLFQEFHVEDYPGYRAYRAATKENPLASEFYEMQKRTMNDRLAYQYLDGLPVALRGRQAYESFDPERNIDSDVQLRDDLPLQVSIDFNIEPGMHLMIGQHDPDRDLFTTCYEIHAPRMSLRTAIDALTNLIARLCDSVGGVFRWPELHIFGDATGRSEWAGTGDSCYLILRQRLDAASHVEAERGDPKKLFDYKIRVPRSNPLVTDRINALNVALCDMDGVAHWVCHPRCERLVEDLKRVKLDDKGKLDKSDPNLSHASDAESYRVWFVRPVRIRDRQGPSQFNV